MSYEETMAAGRAEYADVIGRLTGIGLPTQFTQTGGMNAALEVWLDGGYSILVTESDDSLAWSRAEHRDWGVALYPPSEQYDGECLMAAVSDDGSVDALLILVQELLASAVARPTD
ncbi:hypothetical protein ACI790_03400 [Blastococcus sp. SYSU DS0539]